jgi:DnaJ homolog subfamily A member 2
MNSIRQTVMPSPDLYAVMGLSRDASADDIKRAYRRESLLRHPDRGGAKEAFQELQEANEILSDPAKKAQYDATGQIPGAAEGGGGGPDLSEVLGSIFGGMGGMGGGIPFPFFNMGGGGMGPGMKAARGPNKVHEIGVSLSDLYHGKTIRTTMKRDCKCDTCAGKGGQRVETCGECRGRGFRMRMQQMGPMTAMTQEPCGLCQQTGSRAAEKCGTCKGRCVIERESTLEVRIEPGMQEGDRIVFPGQCSESPMFEAPGDVILVVRTASSDSGTAWNRHGADLMIEVEVSVAESLLGWTRTLDGHPSGSPVRVTWTGGVLRHGQHLVVAGQGMPVRNGGGFGNLVLIVRIRVEEEEALSEEQRRLLQSVWSSWVAPDMTQGVLSATSLS